MTVAARAVGTAPSPGYLLHRSTGHWQLAAGPPPSGPTCGVQLQLRHIAAAAGGRCQAARQLAAASVEGGVAPAPALPAGGFGAWPETARVALRTGAYITALGLSVLVAPVTTFGLLFDASSVPCGWIRVGGVLMTLFGSYYLGGALDDAEGRYPRHFYATTILGRLALSAAFALLVATRQCPPALLWLAAANAASSILLWRAAARRAAAAEAHHHQP